MASMKVVSNQQYRNEGVIINIINEKRNEINNETAAKIIIKENKQQYQQRKQRNNGVMIMKWRKRKASAISGVKYRINIINENIDNEACMAES